MKPLRVGYFCIIPTLWLKKPVITGYFASNIEKEYIIIYVKGEKPIKIDRYNENVEVLLMRLKDEKISVM